MRIATGRNDSSLEPPPRTLDLPIGTGRIGMRQESDSLGTIEVPAEHYWGAQTQRSLQHFAIGDRHLPKAVYHAYGYIKKAAAIVNADQAKLSRWMADVIVRVADEVIAGQLDAEFPLYVWQSGSGTHTNMNVNEVIANRANQLLGGQLGSKQPIHPNDHVNMSQSSNDTFPTAMHIAVVLALQRQLFPSLASLENALTAKATQFADIVKIGRTHLQDAVPLTVGQEWSGYATQVADAVQGVRATLPGLYQLALGGTAVGTGLNAPRDFGPATATLIAEFLQTPFVSAPNKFAALASVDPMVATQSCLRGLALALIKVANDIRWLASGPRSGLHELLLPENEPGSSIMPGKVNPSQVEALLMVCVQVIGLDAAVAFAASLGNFEVHVMRPVIIDDLWQSIGLIADACEKFRLYCIEGIRLDEAHIRESVNRSLMLVTALSPVLGYDRAAIIARKAMNEGTTLREAAIASGCISPVDFDRIVDPLNMVR
jgi:fumarate hydratase class II